MSSEGRFLLKRKTSFSEMAQGFCTELPESDLCFQDGQNIYQFKFEKEQVDKTYEIKSGTFMFVDTSAGLELKKIDFKHRSLLDSVTNTSKIIKEANTFFNKLHVYERLGRVKKRGVLLYSSPGMGKTSAIEKVCLDLVQEDPGTVVVVWPTSNIDADDIMRLLGTRSHYTQECTRMVLVIEDIGGGEREAHSMRNGVDSGLLNLLDGVGVVFKLPTFIIATTNHPENLLASLADRPGRFDLMMKLQAPSHQEKIELMRFICKRVLTEEEQQCLGKKGTEEFSIAHLEEIAVRAELHDKTHMQVVEELIKHKELFAKDFEDRGSKIGLRF